MFKPTGPHTDRLTGIAEAEDAVNMNFKVAAVFTATGRLSHQWMYSWEGPGSYRAPNDIASPQINLKDI